MAKSMKRESGGSSSSIKTGRENVEAGTPSAADRRVLRSRYHAFKNRISDKKKDISRVDTDKFYSIIDEFESLHQLVQKPREQVADAETLLNIANTLVAYFKVHGDGVSPSDFVSCILRDFVRRGLVSSSTEEDGKSICWKDIGVAVSHVFRRGPECCTMLGPMNSELRQRKHNVQRKHVRPTEKACPEELDGAVMEEKTGTDKNMSVMFDILKKNGRAKLESLVMNRSSFSQTVENLFALSFLVKDGRVEITIDQKGCHIVAPRNAPPASAVANGDVSYSHFVFRFDFKDWKLMKESSKMGEELMQRREQKGLTSCSQAGSEAEGSQVGDPKTLSRNHGLVKQERAAVEGSSENENATDRTAAIRKGKRKVR